MVDPYASESRTGAQDACAGEQWSVATRSPSNFGFAKLANLRAAVGNTCGWRFTDIAAAMKSNGTVAQKGTGWSDVNQIGSIYTASFTAAGGQAPSFTFCWWRKLQGVLQVRAAMGRRLSVGDSRLAVRGSGEQRPGS
jgi:hypothetical protein